MILILLPVLVLAGGGVAAAVWWPPAATSADGGGAAPPAPAPKPTTASGVFARDVGVVLEQRGRALRAKDEQAFLAGFDPTQPALVATERVAFRNLTKLPLVSPGYRLEDNSSAPSSTLPGATESDVTMTEQVRGVDGVPVAVTDHEFWVRRGGKLLVGKVERKTTGSRAALSPVEQVPLTIANGPLVTVAVTSDVDNLTSISSMAERAAAAVRKLWNGRPGPSRFIVFLTHNPAGMKSWFGGDDGSGALGVTTPLFAASGDRSHYAGARVLVDLTRTSSSQLYSTLRHEFTHAMTTQVQAVATGSSDPYPVWAEEGFAAWSEELEAPLARSHRLQELRYFKSRWHGQLPPDTRDGFYTSEPQVFVNYDCAALIFRYVATRWGQEKAVDYYVHIASGRPGDAAQDELGVSSGAFSTAWADWVTGLLAQSG